MKFIAALSFIVLCARPCVALDAGSPVEKVVKLLTDLQEKIKADGGNEKTLYEKYSCWCTGMTSKKGGAIEQAKKDLKRLGSEVVSLRGDVAKYSSEINDAAQDMEDNHKSQQTATELRDKENSAFTATRAEMSQAVQSLNQALKMLKMTPQFLQTSQSLSTQAAEAVRSAIAAIPDKALRSLPAAKLSQIQNVGTAVAQAKYDPSYGSLVTILEEMYSTFASDLEKETKTEATANKDYEDLMDTKVKEVVALQQRTDKREESKAQAASDLADTTQNYDDTESQMKDDIEFFDNAVDSCQKKANAWEGRTKMRDEELAGITKALEILTSDSARALFAKAIDAGARTSFLQVEATPAMPEGQLKAFKVLKSFATQSRSVALAKIAAQVRLAQGGHFDAVLGAIDKVIGVLKTEQEEDNKKKTQCNDEYQNVAQTSSNLEWKIEKNEAKIDKLETTVENKEQEKADTILAIKDTKQEITDMTKERKDANEAFEEAKKDDQDAVKLLTSAKDALLAFYEKHKQNEALSAFIQGEPEFDRGNAAPDAKFSGKGSRAGQTKGINLLLQNIIEGLQDEIQVQIQVEKDAVAAFNKALKAAEALQKSLEGKESNLKKQIAGHNKDKDDEDKQKLANQKDLKSEEDYKAKIKPDCDFMIDNWQSRYNKRKAEMDGLVTAKDFLAGAMKGAALVETSKSSPGEAAPTSLHAVSKKEVAVERAVQKHQGELLPIGQGAYQDPKAVEQRTKDKAMHCEESKWHHCYGEKGDFLDGHSYGNHQAPPLAHRSGSTPVAFSAGLMLVLTFAMVQ